MMGIREIICRKEIPNRQRLEVVASSNKLQKYYVLSFSHEMTAYRCLPEDR